MHSRRSLFLLAFFVLFAAFPGGMAFASGMKGMTGASAAMTMTCHESMTADADASSMTPHHGHAADAGQQGDDPVSADSQSPSDCCVSFAGILSMTVFSPMLPGAREAIAFSPSLRLAARVAGIYRPPRQYA
ncbi:MAG: hypothetical protein LBD06_10935 [Candidatus Accumulibacter sp.]|nr:hypothetical protein [Accumulibacter sp.]